MKQWNHVHTTRHRNISGHAPVGLLLVHLLNEHSPG